MFKEGDLSLTLSLTCLVYAIGWFFFSMLFSYADSNPRSATLTRTLPDTGIKDDVVPNEDDQELLIIMASAAVSEELGLLAAKQLVKQSIAARPLRATDYAAIQY